MYTSNLAVLKMTDEGYAGDVDYDAENDFDDLNRFFCSGYQLGIRQLSPYLPSHSLLYYIMLEGEKWLVRGMNKPADHGKAQSTKPYCSSSDNNNNNNKSNCSRKRNATANDGGISSTDLQRQQ